MKQIVFLATAWGSKYGGINSFNFDLCKEVAKQLKRRNEYQVVCVVLDDNQATIEKAKNDNNIELIPLECDTQDFETAYADEIADRLHKRTFNQVEWWIGHDVISGEVALRLKKIDPTDSSQVALIHHMDYGAYKSFQRKMKMKEVSDIISSQRQLFKKAEIDKVFAVGPYLQESAQSICDRNVKLLIPGLIEHITPVSPPPLFHVVTFGRLGEKNDTIKQVSVAVRAFGRFIRKCQDSSHPSERYKSVKMWIFGSEENAEDTQKLLEEEGEREADRTITLNFFPYEENREKLWEEIKTFSVCLMISSHEGFGLAGWEAIGLEVPLILSKQSGLYQFLIGERLTTSYVQDVDIKGGPQHEHDIETVANCINQVNLHTEKYKDDAEVLKRTLLERGYTWERTAHDFLEALKIKHHKTSDFGKEFAAKESDISNIEITQNQTILNLLEKRTDLGLPYRFDFDAYRTDAKFQGRYDELEWLREQFRKVLESSKSRTVLIKGERGIGKTRLIHRFSEELIKEHQVSVIIRDFEKEYFETKIFPQLTVDVCSLYTLADLAPDTPIRDLKEIGNTILKEKTGNISETTETIEIASLFLNLLQELAQQHPLVIILENLHKAPQWALEFFEKAALKAGKFLLIGAVLSDTETPNIKASKSKKLKGLSCYEGRALVDSLYSPSSLNEEFYQRLIERTQGNPFFILEVMEYLKEERIIKKEKGGWVFQEDLEKLPCWTPESLQDFVRQKLAILDESAEETIKRAAVIGPRFLHRLLHKVARYTSEQVDESIRAMIKQGLIKVVKNDADDMLPGSDITYHFQPQIIQEVLYEENSNPLLHLTIAQFLEELYQDKNQERLQFWCAYHYLLSKNAGEALPFLEKLIHDKQLPFESIWLLKRTLEKFASSLNKNKEVKLRRNLAQKYSEVGRLDDAFENYKEARKVADQGKVEYEQSDRDKHNELNILAIDLTVEMGWIKVKQADFISAGIFFQEADERLKNADYNQIKWLPVKLYRLYGGVFLEQLIAFPKKKDQEVIDNASKYTYKAKEYIDQWNPSDSEGLRHKILVLNNLGRLFWEQSKNDEKDSKNQDVEKAERYFKEAFEVAKKVEGSITLKAYIQNNLGVIAAERGVYDDAETYYKESLTHTDREENVFLRTKTLLNLAELYLLRESYEQALKSAEEGRWYAELIDHRIYQFDGCLLLAKAYWRLDRLEEARSFCAEAQALNTDNSRPDTMIKIINEEIKIRLQQEENYE